MPYSNNIGFCLATLLAVALVALSVSPPVDKSLRRFHLGQNYTYIITALHATLFCSYANLLLIFVPLGIIAGQYEWSSVAVFTLNFIAIFPLAALLSYSTDELSAKVGLIVEALINASFGNAVKMIVSCYCACIV
jgi:hypothetical protein